MGNKKPPVNHDQLTSSVQGHIHAWHTNDIGRLFAVDARCYAEPFAEP